MFGSVVLRLRFGRPCSLLRLRRKELAMNKICEKASVFAAAVAVVAACAVSGCAPNASNPASDTALGDGAGTAGVSWDMSRQGGPVYGRSVWVRRRPWRLGVHRLP